MIFIYKDKSKSEVYDLDTTQKFPCAFEEYVDKGIRSDGPLKPNYRRYEYIYMGCEARKPVFWDLQATQAQTSLRIRAV